MMAITLSVTATPNTYANLTSPIGSSNSVTQQENAYILFIIVATEIRGVDKPKENQKYKYCHNQINDVFLNITLGLRQKWESRKFKYSRLLQNATTLSGIIQIE